MMREAEIIERPWPSSEDAERAILGAMLLGNPEAPAIFARLKPDDFLSDYNGLAFAQMLALSESHRPIDLVTLTDQLNCIGKLDAAGGAGYLAQLLDGVPRVSNVEHYARIVKEKSVLRKLIHVTGAIQLQAFDATEDAGAILDRGIESISEIACDLEADRDSGTPYRDAAASLLASFDSAQGIRVYTDVDELDRLIGGLRAGELALITADTGVGKTRFAQQVRRRACRDGYHGLYASGEMLAPHLVSRELATQAEVEHWKMRRPERITKEELHALVEAAARECERCRILDGELSIARIRRVARQMKSRAALDLAILDYDELIEAPGKDEFEQQRYLVRAAKSLAVEMKCPVILISQLRKSLQGEDRKKPTLQRLYGSGAKAKHSSIVIYVDRPYVQELSGDETAARLVVLKNRDGKVGAIEATFNVKTLCFESIPKAQPAGTAEAPRRDWHDRD